MASGSLSRRGALRVLGAAGFSAAGASLATSAAGAPARALPVARRLGHVPGTSLIGMSTTASLWDARVRSVGSGLGARRIFADLADGATSQLKLIEAANADGMLPVISYKVGNDKAGAASGKYNAAAEKAAARLASYDLHMAVTVWHEPYGDLTGAEYTAITKKVLPIFKRGRIQVGPILNGWLLDNKVSTFASYCPDELFSIWNWFGVDAYEEGTITAPGRWKPADRILAARRYLQTRGFGTMPLGVGEYNGYSGATIEAAGQAIYASNTWFGCLWNTTGSKGHELTGERLDGFKRTLADPRRARNAFGV